MSAGQKQESLVMDEVMDEANKNANNPLTKDHFKMKRCLALLVFGRQLKDWLFQNKLTAGCVWRNMKWLFVITAMLHWGIVFAQNNKKSDVESSFDQSLSDELEEGFSDIEAADEEEFGSPQNAIKTEESLISEEFEDLEQEEDTTTKQTKSTTDSEDILGQEPTDADLDAKFSEDELEIEESEMAETPQLEDTKTLDEELIGSSEDELEIEETDIVKTPPSEDKKTLDEELVGASEDELEMEESIEEVTKTQKAQDIPEEDPLLVEDITEEQAPLQVEDEAEDKFVEEVPEPEPIPEPVLEEPTESLAVFTDDEPNRVLEAFLDRIFRENSERLSDERWLQIAQSLQEDTYRIQVGDTLWDISVTFFGDGHFWPKLWQLNNRITNPHLIYPGRTLRFISGGIETAPAIEVTDVEQEELEQVEQAIQEQVTGIEEDISEGQVEQIVIEDPILPSPIKSKPVLKKLPLSLLKSRLNLDNIFSDGAATSLNNQKNVVIESIEPEIDETEVQAFHFLSEGMPRALGRIVDIEDWHKVASLLQHIYIYSPGLNVGGRYVVYRRKGGIRGAGHSIEIQGEIEVMRKLPRPRNIYKAVVRKSNTMIEEGSRIARLSIPSIKLNLEGRSQDAVRARVVGGGNIAAPHSLFATYTIVFLDRGSRSGIAVGDILTIQRNQRIRNKSRWTMGDTPPIAKVKVARVTPRRTTAFVVHATDSVLVGDYTRGRRR